MIGAEERRRRGREKGRDVTGEPQTAQSRLADGVGFCSAARNARAFSYGVGNRLTPWPHQAFAGRPCDRPEPTTTCYHGRRADSQYVEVDSGNPQLQSPASYKWNRADSGATERQLKDRMPGTSRRRPHFPDRVKAELRRRQANGLER